MSDISKCLGENCPVRDICYRFTAPADPHWQSYMEPDRNGHECKSFWPAKPSISQSPSTPEIPDNSPLKIEGSKNT